MLVPIEILFPINIVANSSHTFTLEDNVSDFPLFDPILMYYNVSAEETHYKITRALTVGNSSNPLMSGTYSKDLVDLTVAADMVLRFEPEHRMLTQRGVYPEIVHTVEITNNSTTVDIIVYAILTGRIWETLAHSPERLPVIR